MESNPVDVTLGENAARDFVRHILDTEDRVGQSQETTDVKSGKHLIEIVTLMISEIMVQNLMGIKIRGKAVEQNECTDPDKDLDVGAIMTEVWHGTSVRGLDSSSSACGGNYFRFYSNPLFFG
jgi:hypothetical protein